ncbi:MAG TPA: hypothetical protein VIJ17_04810 [Pseudolabrys sp.]
MALAGCTHDGQPSMSAAQPRGATVAFESIDGPPPAQFNTLVQNLNDEAQARRLAVISRDSPSAYRVRGYLAAKVVKGQTTIAWVWDVFDGDEHRSLRISGEETANSRPLGRHRDAWTAADDAMIRRIAHASMEQLAAFLTSPEIAPGTPVMAGAPLVALGARDSSPEAAGIYRIFHPNADPTPAEAAQAPAAADGSADSVPVPQRRPDPDAAVSGRETLTLAAASQ